MIGEFGGRGREKARESEDEEVVDKGGYGEKRGGERTWEEIKGKRVGRGDEAFRQKEEWNGEEGKEKVWEDSREKEEEALEAWAAM